MSIALPAAANATSPLLRLADPQRLPRPFDLERSRGERNGPRGLRITRSVLIVDDDATLRDQLAELFRMEGYAVILAEDGLAALRLLVAGTEPDVILLDMHMEGLDGWDLGAELLQLQLTAPVLVITGDADPRRCAQQIGAQGYLAKPFALGTLLDAVEHLLQP
jgi:two-component system, chemotaxis family, chemotaxis protein CheY